MSDNDSTPDSIKFMRDQIAEETLRKAAPALLESLEGMAMLWKVTCGLKGWQEDATAEYLKAKAAIAAARGEE